MTTPERWYAFLIVGQGVTLTVGYFVVRRLIRQFENVTVLMSLIYQQTNDAVVELQRHRGILKFKPPDPPESDPPLFIG